MDYAAVIGILVAFGLVIASIMMGGSGIPFVNFPSIMIIESKGWDYTEHGGNELK